MAPRLIDALTGLIQLGVNLTDRQKAYLEWCASDEGRAHFKQEEDNEFYEALARGDTSVLDVRIKETQDKIDKLNRSLGLTVVMLILCLSCSGCWPSKTIPRRPLHAVSESLIGSERSYAIENAEVHSPDGDKTLEGTWYIVSSDRMKVDRRNQQQLLGMLEMLQDTRKLVWYRFFYGLGLGFAFGAVIGFMFRRR